MKLILLWVHRRIFVTLCNNSQTFDGLHLHIMQKVSGHLYWVKLVEVYGTGK